ATVRASLPNGTSVVFNLTVSAPVQAKADPLPPASGDQGFAGEARKGA
ncbi:MAG: hypothetical protein RL318_2008, partial [Fibrobacterota bacterium]